jgi:hypothetical protein
LDRLPPTVTDPQLLVLLGRVLANDPAPQATGALRLRFFQPGFSWQALVDLAVDHELLPALVFALIQQELLPPVPSLLNDEARQGHVTNRLLIAYQEHLERQTDLKQQLETALHALNNEAIEPVLLKGALHLTLPQSEWHQARGMRDLDILVPETEAARANQILVSLGYRADHDPPPLDRHLPELRRAGRAGTIEIHTEALSFPARHALATADVFALAQPRSLSGARFRALPSEWHLLHGLAHHQLADRGHARRMLAIKGLWEFSRVARELTPQKWSCIIAHAEKRGVLDVLSSWSIQANRLFGLDVPPQLLTSGAGRKHAEVTLRRATAPHRLRQALFVADKLRFAFSPKTLSLRYGSGDARIAASALRHAAFLWRRRGLMVRRWLGG